MRHLWDASLDCLSIPRNTDQDGQAIDTQNGEALSQFGKQAHVKYFMFTACVCFQNHDFSHYNTIINGLLPN